MKITRKVKTILDNYGSDSPGVKANLARILMQGKLGGTGKICLLYTSPSPRDRTRSRMPSSA